MFIIPALLAFYEIPLRSYFPRLPSLFAIAFKLYQRGNLTMETVLWLASSLPASFLGGLGALGGVAMQTTAFMAGGVASAGGALVGTASNIAGGAASAGSALVGTASGIAGGAASAGSAIVGSATGIAGNASKSVVQGISHLNPGIAPSDVTHALSGGAKKAADQATSITTAGVQGAAALANGTTNAVAGGLSLVKNGLSTGENGIAFGSLVPDIAQNTSAIAGTAVGATKSAVTESTAKLANVLDSVNPLHALSQDSKVCGAYRSATDVSNSHLELPLSVLGTRCPKPSCCYRGREECSNRKCHESRQRFGQRKSVASQCSIERVRVLPSAFPSVAIKLTLY